MFAPLAHESTTLSFVAKRRSVPSPKPSKPQDLPRWKNLPPTGARSLIGNWGLGSPAVLESLCRMAHWQLPSGVSTSGDTPTWTMQRERERELPPQTGKSSRNVETIGEPMSWIILLVIFDGSWVAPRQAEENPCECSNRGVGSLKGYLRV